MGIFFEKDINQNEVSIYNKQIEKDMPCILNFVNNFIEDKIYDNFEFIGEGVYGIVYRYKNYAIKLFFERNQIDIKILSKIHNLKSYPELYAGCEGYFMVSEFIEGKVLEYCNINNVSDNCLIQLKNDLQETLKMKICPDDIHPRNIILNKKGFLKIVDVGSFHMNDMKTYHIIEKNDKKLINNLIYKECFFDISDKINAIENILQHRAKNIA